jgi:two-component system, sensor histidine kinase and response regulator
MVKLESPEAVLAALRTPVAVHGEEGALLVNEPLRQLVGLEPGAGVGELPGFAEALAGIGKAGLAGETRLPTVTDRSIPVSYTTSAISWMGKSAVLVELRDETTTVETRQRLIQAETRFKLLTRSAPFGVWDQDRITGHWYFSPKVYALLGLEMDCTLDPQTLFSTMVVPEDLPLIRARTAAAFRNRALYDSVFRIILPDGALRTVRATGLSDHLPDGRVARFAGILQPAEEQVGSRHDRDTASRSAVERLRAVLHANEAQPAEPVNAGGPDNEEGMALSELAAGSARPFLEIMDDLLELSGLRAGAQLMSAGSFNVFETLTLATERRCQGDRCPLSLIIDPRANAEFVGYSGTWRRVVAAMLDHAIGRSGEQGVEVRLTVG